MTKRSLFSPLCTYIVDAVMASIYTSIHLPRSRTAVLQRTSARFSMDGKFLKLLKGLTVGQAVLEIPLSKLELHRAFVFARFPYTSPYTHAFVRVCTCKLPCIFIRVYYISCIVYTMYTPRVLHFSAFIDFCIYLFAFVLLIQQGDLEL